MGTVASQILTAMPGPPSTSDYVQDLLTAFAAMTTLAVLLAVIAGIIAATFKIIRKLTEAALSIVIVLVVMFVLIGWLNR